MGIKGFTSSKAFWLAFGLTLKFLKNLEKGKKVNVDGDTLLLRK
jgi:hypothetical protein